MAIFLLAFFLFADLDIRYIFGYLLLGVIFICYFIRTVLSGGLKQELKELFKDVKALGFKAAFKAHKASLAAEFKAGLASGFSFRISAIKILYILFAAVIIFYSILPGSYKNHEAVSSLLSLVIFSVYFVYAEPGKSEVQRILGAIQIMATVFAVYTIVFSLIPDVFLSKIYPLLSEYSQARHDELLPQGYGVMIGASTSYAIFIMCFALFMNEAKLIFGKVKERKNFLIVVCTTVLYLTSILLMNRRSELIAVLVTGLFLFVLSLFRSDKKGFGIKAVAVGIILVIQLFVVMLLAPTGRIDRHVDTIDKLLPDGISISDIFDKNDDGTGVIITPGTPDIVIPEEPSDEPHQPVDTNELTSGRMALWKLAVQLFKEEPVFGIGWRQFVPSNTYQHGVHNTYLQWLCETGIVGFVILFSLFAAIMLISLTQVVRIMRLGDNVPYFIKELCFVSLGVQIVFAIIHFMDSTFYHLYFFVFYSLTMVLIESALRFENEHTGGNSDWLRKKFFAKKTKRILFR